MPMIGFGDLAQSQQLRHHTAQTKANLSRLSQEMVTGQAADTPRHVSGDMGPLIAIDSSLARLQGFASTTRELSRFAEAMQTGLENVSSVALAAGNNLISASGTVTPSHVNAAVSAAQSALQTVVSTLNSRYGDRSLFAGQDSTSQVLIGADELLLAMETAVTASGATTPAGVEAALDAWFGDPAGFVATAYLGGPSLSTVPIAEGEAVGLDVTANDPALRNTLKGLAMAALVDRGLFAGQTALRQQMAQRGGEVLLSSETDRAYLSAHLGGLQGQIDRAQTRNEAEVTAFGIARSSMVAVDPYEAATKLQDSEAQLELIYAITARISRLSLADYI